MCPPVSLRCGHHYGCLQTQGLEQGWVQRQREQAGGIQGQGLLVAGGVTCPQAAELQWYKLYKQQK